MMSEIMSIIWLPILMIAAVLITLGAAIFLARMLGANKGVKDPALKSHSLTSHYFLGKTFFYCGFFCILFVLDEFYPEYDWLIIPLILIFAFAEERLKTAKKMKQKQFDEREEIIMLKTGQSAGYICLVAVMITAIQHNQLSKLLDRQFLLFAPAYIYWLGYNLAGWYYFRKNEKELQNENQS